MALGATAGLILTVLAGSEPGILLGLLVIAATVAGGSAVRPGAAYLIIPFPAPAYFGAAVIAGLIHDRAMDTSTTALALNFTQWMAGGFLWMLTATILAIAVVVARWLMTGQAAWRLADAWTARRAGHAPWAPQPRSASTRNAATARGYPGRRSLDSDDAGTGDAAADGMNRPRPGDATRPHVALGRDDRDG